VHVPVSLLACLPACLAECLAAWLHTQAELRQLEVLRLQLDARRRQVASLLQRMRRKGGSGGPRLGSSANSSRQTAVLSQGYVRGGGSAAPAGLLSSSQHDGTAGAAGRGGGQGAPRLQPGPGGSPEQQPQRHQQQGEEGEEEGEDARAGMDFTTQGHLSRQEGRVFKLQERLARKLRAACCCPVHVQPALCSPQQPEKVLASWLACLHLRAAEVRGADCPRPGAAPHLQR
jgi:hypothetical protein